MKRQPTTLPSRLKDKIVNGQKAVILPTTPVNEKPGKSVIPGSKSTDKETTGTSKKKQAAPQKKKEPLLEPITPDKEDTGIYFDDGFGEEPATTPNSSKKSEKELDDIYLDDEYYELDGF